jgi:ferrous iron transport protein A
MMPLGLLTAGETAEIVSERRAGHECGCREKCDGRMEDMGLRAGKSIEVLNNGGRGPLLIKVDESRIAIGRGTAMKIMVRRKV